MNSIAHNSKWPHSNAEEPDCLSRRNPSYNTVPREEEKREEKILTLWNQNTKITLFTIKSSSDRVLEKQSKPAKKLNPTIQICWTFSQSEKSCASWSVRTFAKWWWNKENPNAYCMAIALCFLDTRDLLSALQRCWAKDARYKGLKN